MAAQENRTTRTTGQQKPPELRVELARGDVYRLQAALDRVIALRMLLWDSCKAGDEMETQVEDVNALLQIASDPIIGDPDRGEEHLQAFLKAALAEGGAR